MNLREVELVKTVGTLYAGTGTFARVVLAVLRHDQTAYALKMINKEILVRMKQVEHAKHEKRTLARLSHPFIVKL